MSGTLVAVAPHPSAAPAATAPTDGPLARIGPNWFTAVMGTGIVANAAELLPHRTPALHDFAVVVWLAAAALLAVLVVATALHWVRYPAVARGHLADPAMAPLYGAPPMALLTVGAGSLLVGRDVLGPDAAVVVASVLWAAGTLGGVLCAAVVPYRLFTRVGFGAGGAPATWLLPVVPPMVSAATGAALVPHVAAGQGREALLLGLYALFGVSLLASLVTIALVVLRLVATGAGEALAVPSLFVVLGPLGQSVTAANLLGAQAHGAIGAPYAGGLQALGVVYGAPVWGFAMLWLAIAAAVVLRAAREHLPFSLGWWSFTFPVGTVVTGTSVLARDAGLAPLSWVAVALFVLLVAAWATVAARTVHGAARRGGLLRAA
ncbi:TDT family transporter [Patulibacter americanus]|uniref:TDT family transporter n=1 Tax=Patulibacter americanus TaxID=588672 RepID=UPI0003B4648E|nr:TDT family transporter [Patulibacter americanus]